MSRETRETCPAKNALPWFEDDSDETLLEHVRAGETALYGVLAQRYNQRLRRAAHRVLPNRADVDDVLQETHLRAFRSINQFEGRSSFGTWLTRIAIHAALSRLRLPAHKREFKTSCPDYDPLEAAVSTQRNPEQQMQDKETITALESAVQALPEPYRTTCYLRWFREVSTTELAGLLKISESCLKTRIHRAKALICKLLQERLRIARSGLVPVQTPLQDFRWSEDQPNGRR